MIRDDRPFMAFTRQGNKNYSPLNFIRMNIGLVDVDGHNFPNFALMRLSAYNKAKGCQVE